MGQLEDMQIFKRVVDAGSITRAAEQLNIAKSAISKRLAELERRLGNQLIQRTTRKSSLTEAGRRYYERIGPLLEEVEEIHGELASEHQALAGSLKLAVPLSFGLAHLAPAIDDFVQRHPELSVEIDFADRKVDIIEEGFDLAFRIGELADSSLKARKIAPIRHVVCASPDYLARHGRPQSPEQLKAHKLLKYAGLSLAGITLFDDARQPHRVQMTPYCVANNGDFLKDMAISGHGIVALPLFIVYQALARGELELLLTDYHLPEAHAYVLYPPNRHLPRKVRALVDFLVARFGQTPYWEQAGSSTSAGATM